MPLLRRDLAVLSDCFCMLAALPPQTSGQKRVGTLTLGLLGTLYEPPTLRAHGAVVGFVDRHLELNRNVAALNKILKTSAVFGKRWLRISP